MSESGAAPRGMTYEEHAALPDDGRRYQLVEGERVVTPSPTSEHQRIAGEVYHRLRFHVDAHGLGEVFVAPLDVVLHERTALQPDVLFVATADHAVLERGSVVFGAPTLCIEVLSPGTASFDRVRKLDLYARFGVAHCWIVDPAARTVEEYLRSGDRYRLVGVTGFDDGFRPALFPGLMLDLAGFGGAPTGAEGPGAASP